MTTIPSFRTMVAVSAALDAVALRIDAAGVRPDQLDAFGICPSSPRVTVQFAAGNRDSFEALVALFPDALVDDWFTDDDGVVWRRAETALRDGTSVAIQAPGGDPS